MLHNSLRCATILGVLAVSWAWVPTADSAARCKVKIDKSTGAVRVFAKGVGLNAKWGEAAGQETSSFASSCDLANQQPNGCPIADNEEDARVPPAGCVIYVAGDTDSCSTFIRGCTPGVRNSGGAAGLPCATQVGNEVYFEGCNVHIRNGTGGTYTATNGTGNLVIGYDEDNGGDLKTGSHNLVIGPNHTYTGFGGLVAGVNHTISGTGTTVAGGESNSATGPVSVVVGGYAGTASAAHTTVVGGASGTASAGHAVAIGGNQNSAISNRSIVVGGFQNSASIADSTVVGGVGNQATSGEFITSLGPVPSLTITGP